MPCQLVVAIVDSPSVRLIKLKQKRCGNLERASQFSRFCKLTPINGRPGTPWKRNSGDHGHKIGAVSQITALNV
jgi:hypothetical protein